MIEYVFENFCWCLNLEVFSLLNNSIFVFLVEVENFWCIYILILLNNKFEFLLEVIGLICDLEIFFVDGNKFLYVLVDFGIFKRL